MGRFPIVDERRKVSYRASGEWGDHTIIGLVLANAARFAHKVAVRDSAESHLTYRALDQESGRVSAYLSRRGVRRGDVVTVCLPNTVETVAIHLGVLRIGAVLNPLPVSSGRAELVHALLTCDSRALFVPTRFRGVDFVELVSTIDRVVIARRLVVFVGEDCPADTDSWLDVSRTPPDLRTVSHSADAPVAVLFTSGTESRAKGAVHSDNTILFGEQRLAAALGLSDIDIAFMASPISHTTGFMHGVVMTLITGGTLSLLDVFRGPEAARQMLSHGCTWTMGATPFLADTMSELEASGLRLPSLRYFLCGGAPIPEVLARRAIQVGVRVLSVYGSTESPPHTLVHPSDDPDRAWNSDGRPLDGIEVRIVGEDGTDVAVGDIGEAWSRGPNTFLGYLADPEIAAPALDGDGWYHSGDLARRLDNEFIRIDGRLKDIIIRGGQNISAREVEEILMTHPAISQVAVVGVSHDRLGEISCAIVVAKPNHSDVTLNELCEFLLAHGVAKYKLPERLETWPALPISSTGKTQKHRIRQQLIDT